MHFKDKGVFRDKDTTSLADPLINIPGQNYSDQNHCLEEIIPVALGP